MDDEIELLQDGLEAGVVDTVTDEDGLSPEEIIDTVAVFESDT